MTTRTIHPALAARRARPRARRSPPAAATTTTAGGAAARRHDHREAESTAAIQRTTPTTPRRRSRSARRTSPSRRCSARSTRRRFAGRGLQRQEGAQPRRRADRAEGAEGRPDLRLPGVHGHRAAVVLRGPDEGPAHGPRRRPTTQVKSRMAKEGITAFPPTPFTSSNEVAADSSRRPTSSGLTKISDLKGKAQDLTLYGSPECRSATDCLLRAAEGLRPEVQEVRPGRHRRSATRC